MAPSKKPTQPWWREGILFFYQISGWILGPLILALIIGKWLDKRFQSEPKYLLISIGIAFLFTNIGLVIETLRYHQRIKEQTDEQDKEKHHENE